MLFFIPLVLLLAACAVAGMVLTRLEIDKRQAFAWTLSAAAEKGIPFSDVAHASAQEYGGRFGTRLTRLAATLDAGATLTAALRAARIRLPAETQLSLELAEQSGRLPETLGRLTAETGEAEVLVRNLQERMAYVLFLSALLLFGIPVLSGYVCMNIFPTLQDICTDFALSNSQSFEWMTIVGNGHPWLGWVFELLGWVCVAAWLLLLLHYSGLVDLSWMLWKAPLLNRVAPLTDRMLVLESLGEEVREGQLLPAALARLAEYYPKRHLRFRLGRVAERVAAGGDPWLSLARAKLLESRDVALLRSAQRAGNLPWALEETAERYLRRRVRRSQWLITIVYPVVLLVFGIIVGLFASLLVANIMSIVGVLA